MIEKKYNRFEVSLFMLQSGAAGKNYIEEVARLIKLGRNDTPPREIALKAIHVIPALLLQKPSKLQSEIIIMLLSKED